MNRAASALIFLTVTACITRAAACATLDDARAAHRGGRLDDALSLYANVVQGDSGERDRAVAMNNACVILTDRGDLAAATDQCEQALALRRKHDVPRRVARTLNNLARIYERRGDYVRARERHREALQFHVALDDIAGQLIAHMNLGVLETNADRPSAALEEYAMADALIDQAPDRGWAASQRVLLQLNTGVVLERIGAYREALSSLDQALAAAPAAAPQRVADVQVNRGVVLRNLGDPRAALDAYEQALSAFEQSGDVAAVANIFLNQALVYWLDLNDLERAVPLMARARTHATRAGHASTLREAIYYSARALLDAQRIDDARAIAATLATDEATRWLQSDLEARTALADNDLPTARRAATEALAHVEAQRGNLVQARHQQRLLTDRRLSYALAVDIAYAVYENDPTPDLAREALAIAARAKALALLEATGQSTTQPPPRDGSAATHSPLLEFLFAGKRLYVWYQDDAALNWRWVDAATVRDAAIRVHQSLRRGSTPTRTAVAPLSALLDDIPDALDTLSIAPDGVLGSVPFDYVLAAKRDDRRIATVLRYVATGAYKDPGDASSTSSATPRLLALARSQSTSDIGVHPALQGLPALPRTHDEIQRVGSFFAAHAEVVHDTAATESRLRNSLATMPTVLHIASHAVFDARLDDGAVLLLGADDAHDGLVYPRDVAQLRLPVNLTVLSACSTALSIDSAGSPLTNLTGAFLAAGSNAVLATLWPVADDASVVMMEQFYAQLARGVAPDRALRAAQLRLAQSSAWSSPSIWAAYVLYGDALPVFPPATRPVLWLVPLFAALVLATGLLRWRRSQ